MENRSYQNEAKQAVKESFRSGVNRQLLSMATGTGKTVVFSQLPDELKTDLPGQMMVLAHREELIDQALKKIRETNPTKNIQKEKAKDHCDPSTADIVVASVATLGRKDSKRLSKFNWDNWDKIITDEAHHSTADSYKIIYDTSGVLVNPKKLLLGVTATPQRSDGKALAEIYQRIVYVYSMRQAIEDGWLVDVRGLRVKTETNLDKVHTALGDFAADELEDAVNNPTRNKLIADTWLKHGEDRQTVAFCVGIQHAKDLSEVFKSKGVIAEAVWGDDPNRADKLEAHKEGRIKVLCNCAVLTEGYDDWRIGCVILARPTKSGVLFTQMVGRGTRLQDGTGNLKHAVALISDPMRELKQDCIIIDVVDSTTRHSLVTLPTLMGLSNRIDLKGKSLIRAVQRLEEAQEEHPEIDFSSLDDVDKIEALVESVSLFDIKFPPEVEENSELAWHGAPDGGVVLLLPQKQGNLHIKQNLLDQYEIYGTIKGKRYRGIRNNIEEAFQAADKLFYDTAWEHTTILKRDAKWHKEPATDAQLKLLMKFYKGKMLPPDLDKGKASRLISSFLAKKS